VYETVVCVIEQCTGHVDVQLFFSYLRCIACTARALSSDTVSAEKHAAGTLTWQDRQCTYNVTWRRVRATFAVVERQYILHILSVLFLALGIQQAMRMCHIVMCGLSGCTVFSPIIS
jgi:hypothetical protein